MPHFIFIQQISVLNILNMLYNLHFFSSKCRLFLNATLFGFCITHILNTGCAKIWKKKSVAKRLIMQGTYRRIQPIGRVPNKGHCENLHSAPDSSTKIKFYDVGRWLHCIHSHGRRRPIWEGSAEENTLTKEWGSHRWWENIAAYRAAVLFLTKCKNCIWIANKRLMLQ